MIMKMKMNKYLQRVRLFRRKKRLGYKESFNYFVYSEKEK
ncbi:hypothetical protein LCGC14_1355440 [marine sediment metagenome]|uniref:Uncharacterized protein n=1 Tax=marine sediment metagenome TaxID=412755 RepID=A0A0F9KVU0_9ZZZZ